MLDSLSEILRTIWENKLRTALTAFSVMWGIFLLIILLGVGQGMQNGVEHQYRDDAINSLWIYRGETTMPYNGLPPGRNIQFENEDYSIIKATMPEVDKITARFFVWGSFPVTFGKNSGAFQIRSVHPDHQYLENTLMVAGRYLNDLDIAEERKTVVIGDRVSQDLFEGANPLGQYINVNGIPFKVVGIFTDEGSEGERNVIYLPISTAQKAFNGIDQVHMIMFTMDHENLAMSESLSDNVRGLLANRHQFDVNDERAIFISNRLESFKGVLQIFEAVDFFFWVVGVLILFAGAVGISNIMFISVKERYKEIGIRKALGASPLSIVSIVLLEAVFIALASGLLGVLAGNGIIKLVNRFASGGEDPILIDAGVGTEVIIVALGILVLVGLLAGLFPALNAARVQPVKVLREE